MEHNADNAEASVWKTVIIVSGVAFSVMIGGTSYCAKAVSDNFKARSIACTEAKGTWLPNSGDGICLQR